MSEREVSAHYPFSEFFFPVLVEVLQDHLVDKTSDIIVKRVVVMDVLGTAFFQDSQVRQTDAPVERL